jgi:hypothetical protein
MGEVEMNDLAKKLARMRFNRAKAHTRRLDKQARLDLFRVVIGSDLYYTRYTLPNKDIRVWLIERRETLGQPDPRGNQRVRFRYIEARVEPVPAHLREQQALAAEEQDMLPG